jgi:hypothetical protein
VRALEMAPRVSGGVAHAMAVGVVCRSSACLWSVPEAPRNESTCTRGTELTSSGQSGPARAGNPGPELRSFVAHFEVRNVSTIMATLEALAITQLMFVLCSAPCKARRFAPPALTRGLWALTVPARRSPPGHYVMAGGDGISWTDLDR